MCQSFLSFRRCHGSDRSRRRMAGRSVGHSSLTLWTWRSDKWFSVWLAWIRGRIVYLELQSLGTYVYLRRFFDRFWWLVAAVCVMVEAVDRLQASVYSLTRSLSHSPLLDVSPRQGSKEHSDTDGLFRNDNHHSFFSLMMMTTTTMIELGSESVEDSDRTNRILLDVRTYI